MFGLGPTEMIVVLGIVVILFGAGKLPKVGEGMGKAISNFKKSISESNQNAAASLPDGDTIAPKQETGH